MKESEVATTPKKRNRPHTRVHVTIETPLAKMLSEGHDGLLDSIAHEALCKHYGLSPVTLQPVKPVNRFYVRAGWVPTVYVWMYRYIHEKGQTPKDARELAIARYQKYVNEGKLAPYGKIQHPGSAQISTIVPPWAPEVLGSKQRLPTVEEVMAMVPKPAGYKFLPTRTRKAFNDALEWATKEGMQLEDAHDYAFAVAYIERLRTA